MRPNIDEYYMQILPLVSSRSTCIRRAFGAILTTSDGKILSTGYNGVISGAPHCIEFPCGGQDDDKGDYSRCMAVHAEQNCLLQCLRLDLAHTMYCSAIPCFTCAKMILNVPNILKVVVGGREPNETMISRKTGVIVDQGFQLLVKNLELMWFNADTKSTCIFTY